MLTINPGTEPLVRRLSPPTMTSLLQYLRSGGVEPWAIFGSRPIVFNQTHVTFFAIMADPTVPQLGERIQPIRKTSSSDAVTGALANLPQGSRPTWSDESEHAVLIAPVTYNLGAELPGPLSDAIDRELNPDLQPQAVELGDLVINWRKAKDELAGLEELVKEARQEILAALEAAQSEVATGNGVPLAKRSLKPGRRTFKTEEFRNTYPDLAEQFTKVGADYEQLDVV